MIRAELLITESMPFNRHKCPTCKEWAIPMLKNGDYYLCCQGVDPMLREDVQVLTETRRFPDFESVIYAEVDPLRPGRVIHYPRANV